MLRAPRITSEGLPVTTVVFAPSLPKVGGAERLALDLAIVLRDHGSQVRVAVGGAVNRQQLTRATGLNVSGIEFVKMRSPTARGPVAIQELFADTVNVARLRRRPIDLFVNTQFRSAVPGIGAVNIQYIHFPHDIYPQFRGPRQLYMKSVAGARLALSGGRDWLTTYENIWCNSRFTASHVGQRWSRQARVVYPSCEQFARGEKDKIILSVGRFQPGGVGVPYKAQDVMVKAFGSAADLHAMGWRLVLAGGLGESSEERGFYEKVVRLAGHAPISFAPNATHDELGELYGRAGLYWHAQGFGTSLAEQPQAQEHFGISTVEAMSAGCIPVVYGTGGPEEVVTAVEGIKTWDSLEGLLEFTRALVHPNEEIEDLRHRVQLRAREFDICAFRSRVLTEVRAAMRSARA